MTSSALSATECDRAARCANGPTQHVFPATSCTAQRAETAHASQCSEFTTHFALHTNATSGRAPALDWWWSTNRGAGARYLTGVPITKQRHIEFLVYRPGRLAAEHLADLRRSGLTDETIAVQRFRTVPPGIIAQLLGYDRPRIVSAYLIPFPDPGGGFMHHFRLKIFPTLHEDSGTVKYQQPRGSGVRIFYPLATLAAVLDSTEPLWLVEGEKKSLAVAQLGFPAIGICGIEGWHVRSAAALHPDFDAVRLLGRVVKLVPDGDWQANDHVATAVDRLADALTERGAIPHLVVLPPAEKGGGIDEYLATVTA
jgi:hypothetical protein